MRNNEQGRSMIEMLGVLAIVGVLSVGGITGYSKAMAKFKTNKLNDQINMLVTNIRTLFSSQRTYYGLTNGRAIRSGIVPEEMYDKLASNATVDSDAEITNPFNGHVYLTHGNAKEDDNGPHSSGDERAFVIGINNIPAATCVSVVTTDWGGNTASGLLAMYAINEDDVDNDVTGEIDTVEEVDEAPEECPDTGGCVRDSRGLPFTIVDATAACGRTGYTAIAWKYE